VTPGGLDGRTLYQLHALRASGAPDRLADRGDGFQRLLGWLDHVAALGGGGVLLTPIFTSSTHGYDTIDPFAIDPRLGDEGDFAEFAAACRERDLRLILDGVFNHVGRAFPHFEDVLRAGSGSPWCGWFRLDFDHDDGDGFRYATFEGHRELVGLNHHSPDVLAWAIDVARHWLDRGADGWRFDAAYAIPRPFLRALTDAIRSTHPNAFVFGEVIHGDYAGFVAESGVDSVTQYELHKAIWSSLNDRNLFELAWALKRHVEFAATFPPMTFVGNHDVTRIASQLPDARHLGAAVAVLLTLPGVPSIYYGDELGWRGVKEHRAGGDDAIRPALPPSAAPADDEQAEALDLHRRLVRIRRERPWLTTGQVELGDVTNSTFAFTVSDGPERVLRTEIAVDGVTAEVLPGWRVVDVGPFHRLTEPTS
jgi:cyclomaltodextrinase